MPPVAMSWRTAAVPREQGAPLLRSLLLLFSPCPPYFLCCPLYLRNEQEERHFSLFFSLLFFVLFLLFAFFYFMCTLSLLNSSLLFPHVSILFNLFVCLLLLLHAHHAGLLLLPALTRFFSASCFPLGTHLRCPPPLCQHRRR